MAHAGRSQGMLRRWWRHGAVLLVLRCAAAHAQPLGNEFQVNTYTTGNQQRASVAAAPAGDFVVAWSSNGSPGSDPSGYSIQARRYDAQGAAVGDQFQVNSSTAQTQTYPAVATDAVGNFVVVWDSNESGDSIQGQRYDSAGTPLGTQFQVNTTISTFRPAVSMAADGSFVAVWTGSTFGAGSEGARVLGQRFAADGTRVGGEFQVNTLTTDNQWFPSVAVLPDGGFVIVFGSYVSAGSDTDGQSVQARLYDANGVPLGAEFQVNTFTPGSQTFPDVSVDPAGDFVVAWHSTPRSSDPNDGEVYARRYGAGGTPLGLDFQINTYTTGLQQFPEVAMDPVGGFVVVWENVNVSLPVQGRRYDSSGTPLGDQFPVSMSPNTGGPHVAMDAESRFVAVFENFPGGSLEIGGLRFAAPPGPIPVKIATIRPGKLFKFMATGEFRLPDPVLDNPAMAGGTLSFSGQFEEGGSYTLPPDCWRGLGPGGDGSKGFRCKDKICRVMVTEKLIKAVCKGDTGNFSLPDPGPVAIRLGVGMGTTHYCAQCGGTPRGNANRIFKQMNCAAPVACP
jgi:hypothetical protein